MNQSLLKQTVIEKASSTAFKHHRRYVQHHLVIVEQMCSELLKKYPSANSDIVFALVRLHDYAKILWINETQGIEQARVLLVECGYETSMIENIVSYLDLIERKMEIDLSTAPLEVQILSSCDAASHYAWLFFSIYRWESPEKTIEELIEANNKKTIKDRERKITLPEVHAFIEKRKELFLERQAGQLPETYFT